MFVALSDVPFICFKNSAKKTPKNNSTALCNNVI